MALLFTLVRLARSGISRSPGLDKSCVEPKLVRQIKTVRKKIFSSNIIVANELVKDWCRIEARETLFISKFLRLLWALKCKLERQCSVFSKNLLLEMFRNCLETLFYYFLLLEKKSGDLHLLAKNNLLIIKCIFKLKKRVSNNLLIVSILAF